MTNLNEVKKNTRVIIKDIDSSIYQKMTRLGININDEVLILKRSLFGTLVIYNEKTNIKIAVSKDIASKIAIDFC